MKDRLERFVRDNRESFDTHEPSDDLWKKITAQKGNQQSIGFQKLPVVSPEEWSFQDNILPKIDWHLPKMNWSIAASIAFLLGLGGYWLNQKYEIAQQPAMVFTNPSLAREVSSYNKIIDTKQSELRQLTLADPALYKEFSGELTQLENSFQVLKTDLPKNPNQEVLIKAMIENLKWQIDLLNQQLNIIQRIKQTNNKDENRKQTLV